MPDGPESVLQPILQRSANHLEQAQDTEGTIYLDLSGFSVAPSYAGRGIGARLLDAALEEVERITSGKPAGESFELKTSEAKKCSDDCGAKAQRRRKLIVQLCTASERGDERSLSQIGRQMYERRGFEATGKVAIDDPWGNTTMAWTYMRRVFT
eukprot:gnl/TRDRNA2_/TRDRNA2_113718_c0_seq1.p1 gnl/TRDRNA2_/TRDRNA2_113718_c0~~gnl/TRDRNA2_/TRDRNA2_113718_c0_seq1.p1  ORF type:complete len:154 (+),score=4.88 gnl/TRDRNA2_/TRDRNA2_113718_c0_seq1:2-463(+)